jgi:hypothetical protein
MVCLPGVRLHPDKAIIQSIYVSDRCYRLRGRIDHRRDGPNIDGWATNHLDGGAMDVAEILAMP